MIAVRAGAHALEIDPDLGARVVSWRSYGEQLLVTSGPDPVEYGMYAMAPWAGRLRGNRVGFGGSEVVLPATYGEWALHGTLLASPVTSLTVEQSADRALVVAEFEQHRGWPWPMSVQLTYALDVAGLSTTIRVCGSAEAFPVVVGWHPWFRRRLSWGEACVWSMDAEGILERGPDHLPTGVMLPVDRVLGPFDDAFRVPSGCARLEWPDSLAIDVSGDADWFVVYDQPEDSVCLEPQSGPPDGLRSAEDQRIVTPGEPWSWSTRWDVRDARRVDQG